MLRVTLGAALIAASVGCGSGAAPMAGDEVASAQTASGVATWSVWAGETEVLVVYGRPGPLISTAPPPPGPATQVTHPFLSAVARSPEHEDQLRRILRASESLEGYLEALQAAGFTVKGEPETPGHAAP